jgi:hypothetical protein
MGSEDNSMGIKNINIQVRGSYPVVSAYEFEFLKELPEIKNLWRESTLYLIVQRPLMYFNKLNIDDDGVINFEISDMSDNPPLIGSLNPYVSGLAREDENYSLKFHLYKGESEGKKYLDYVAEFSVETISSEHAVSITPQKIIHLAALKSQGYKLTGDIDSYINYKVHYIGQAFDQGVWSRLTGHEKMQSILTREAILDNVSNRSSFEISLILLEVVGFSEANIFTYQPWQILSNVKPILHDVGDENDVQSYMDFNKPKVEFSDPTLTNEVEAMLINRFKPEYNKVRYKNYPLIKNGTRSKGYTEASLVIESNPTTLETSNFKLHAVFI